MEETTKPKKPHVNHWNGNHPFQRAGRAMKDQIEGMKQDPDSRHVVNPGNYSYSGRTGNG